MLIYIIRNMLGFYLFVLIDNSGVSFVIQHNVENQENRVLFYKKIETHTKKLGLKKETKETLKPLHFNITAAWNDGPPTANVSLVKASWVHLNWMKINLINRSQQK